MSAATMTPAAASAELLIEMYELVQRYDDDGGYLDDLNECGELADMLGAALRRFRGRITRLRKAAEQPKPKTEAAAASAAAVKAEHEPVASTRVAGQAPPSPAASRAVRRLPAQARARVARWSRRAACACRSAMRHFGNFVQRVHSKDDPGASNQAEGITNGPGGRPMSYFMDYGEDWPPRPPRRRGSFRRWVERGKRRRRPGFDRWVVVNVALIVLTGVIVAFVLKLTDHHEQRVRFNVNHSTSSTACPDVDASSKRASCDRLRR